MQTDAHSFLVRTEETASIKSMVIFATVLQDLLECNANLWVRNLTLPILYIVLIQKLNYRYWTFALEIPGQLWLKLALCFSSSSSRCRTGDIDPQW